MESIAAPIEDIQFPTVTVCQDEFKEPDNWAAIEAILNNVAFTCKENPRSWDKVMPCEATEKVRNDFQFLIKSVVEIFKTKVLGDKQTLNSPLYAKELQEISEDKEFLSKIFQLFNESKITKEEFDQLPIRGFSKIKKRLLGNIK